MYSRQPPNIAPSRLVPKAMVGSAVVAKRFAKMTLAAMIGMNARATATTSLSRNGRDRTQEVGTSHASTRPPNSTTYIVRSGGVGNRRVTSTAARTATSTPPKTSALTNHVVPKYRANPVTLFVSSSKKATPSMNRSR